MASSVSRFLSRLALPLFLLTVVGCGEEVEVVELEPLTMPDNHSVEAAAAQQQEAAPSSPQPPAEGRQVVVPEAVAGRYRGVELVLRNPQGGEQRLMVDVGTELAEGALQVRSGELLPDFIIRGNTITSETAEPNNPAIWLEVADGDVMIFQGWLFGAYPELTPPLVEGYQLTLKRLVERSENP